jgi:hypothetical protein
MKRLLVCLLLALLLAISGCSNKEPSTPSDAMVQFIEATHEGNEPKLFAALEASEAQKEFMRVTMDFITAISDFRDAFTNAYGQQAWSNFQDDTKGPKDGNAKLSTTDSDEAVAKYRNAAFDERGDEAFCPNLDEPGKTIRIIKVGSGWRVDANYVCPTTVEMQKKIRQIKPLTDVIRKYKKAIGHQGIKPEDIDAELGRAMLKVLRGLETPAPHRFDIHEL